MVSNPQTYISLIPRPFLCLGICHLYVYVLTLASLLVVAGCLLSPR